MVMKKGKEVSGLAVMKIPEGNKEAVVIDPVIDEESSRILGFTVKKRGVLRPKRFLSLKAIKKIGNDAVTISKIDNFKKLDKEIKLLDKEKRPIDQKILTDKGQEVGRIDDVVFDEETGEILGYEISGGVVKDVLSGKSFLPALEDVEYGEAAVVIPEEMLETIKTGGRGLQSIAEEINLYSSVVTEKAKEVLMHNEERLVLGKVASRDIVADDGTVIIKTGDSILQEHVDEAKSYGKLHELAIAAGITEAVETWKTTVKSARDLTGDMLRGKVAGKTVLDDEGKEIVAEGQVIGEEQIELAKEKNKLSTLGASAARGLFKS